MLIKSILTSTIFDPLTTNIIMVNSTQISITYIFYIVTYIL